MDNKSLLIAFGFGEEEARKLFETIEEACKQISITTGHSFDEVSARVNDYILGMKLPISHLDLRLSTLEEYDRNKSEKEKIECRVESLQSGRLG